MKIKVEKIVENGDGTVTLDFEVDDEAEVAIAKSYGVTVEELTQEQLQEFVMRSLNEVAVKAEQENKQS
jgi:hypothetical protein